MHLSLKVSFFCKMFRGEVQPFGGGGGGGGGGGVEGLGGKLPLNEILHVVLIYKTPLTFSAVVDTMD